jgi:hypothetical protein
LTKYRRSSAASAISRPAIQLDLGITTYVNGIATSQAQIDTSMVAVDTIDYVVIVQSGVTSASTRTVIVQAPPAPTSSPNDGREFDERHNIRHIHCTIKLRTVHGLLRICDVAVA